MKIVIHFVPPRGFYRKGFRQIESLRYLATARRTSAAAVQSLFTYPRSKILGQIPGYTTSYFRQYIHTHLGSSLLSTLDSSGTSRPSRQGTIAGNVNTPSGCSGLLPLVYRISPTGRCILCGKSDEASSPHDHESMEPRPHGPIDAFSQAGRFQTLPLTYRTSGRPLCL